MMSGWYTFTHFLPFISLCWGLHCPAQNGLPALKTDQVVSCPVSIPFDLGISAFNQMQYDKALGYFIESVDMLAGDSTFLSPQNPERYSLLAQCHHYIGLSHYNLGDFHKAIKSFNQAIHIARSIAGAVPNQDVLGTYYLNAARAWRALGDYERSLDMLLQAAACNQGDTVHLSNVYNNFGLVYYEMKDYKRSSGYFEEALHLRTYTFGADHVSHAILYNNIGNVHYHLGRIDSSLYYYRYALHLYREHLGTCSEKVAFSCNNMAGVYADLKMYDSAVYYYEQCLHIRKELYGEKHYKVAQVWRNLAALFYEGRMTERAMECIDRSVASNIKEGNLPEAISELTLSQLFSVQDMIEILDLKARILLDLYRESGDNKRLKDAFRVVSTYMELLATYYDYYHYEESKLWFAGQIKPMIALAMQIACETGDAEAAFHFMETGKSFTLFQFIIENNLRRNSLIPDSMVTTEKTMKAILSDLDTRIKIAKANNDEENMLQLTHSRSSYAFRYDSIRTYEERHFPIYAALKKRLEKTALSEIQSMLSEETGILQYFIHGAQVFIFLMSRDSLEVIWDSCGQKVNQLSKELIPAVCRLQMEDLMSKSLHMSQLIIHPIQDRLENMKALVVIPDEDLFRIPIEVLLLNRFEGVNGTQIIPEYLIKEFTVTCNYSSRLWYLGKKHAVANGDEMDREYIFLGFAPVFSGLTSIPEGIQPADHTSTSDTHPDHFLQNSFSVNIPLDELAFSEKEVQGIYSLFKENDFNGMIFTGSSATKQNFENHSSHFDFIHLATHAVGNRTFPDLGGLYFFPVNSERRFPAYPETAAMNPDFLYSSEIGSLDIQARLVVLSACATGIGQLHTAEGMLALSRSFLMSGAQNVVTTLWDVSDRHTADFMVRFYGHILHGYPFPEALRLTKLHYIQSPNVCHPFFWSGYIIVGQ